jgi:hypothetical protein
VYRPAYLHFGTIARSTQRLNRAFWASTYRIDRGGCEAAQSYGRLQLYCLVSPGSVDVDQNFNCAVAIRIRDHCKLGANRGISVAPILLLLAMIEVASLYSSVNQVLLS